jgi:putative transposase
MIGYDAVPEPHRGLVLHFGFYNDDRPHESLDYRAPAAVYRGGRATGA